MRTIKLKSGKEFIYDEEDKAEIMELLNKREDDYSFLNTWFRLTEESEHFSVVLVM